EICAAYAAGDMEKSRQLQLQAIPLINQLFCEVNPIPVKAAMNRMGKEVGPMRMPLTDMEPQNLEKLAQAMKEYGILS
ncbi:MAG: dihydrodipicolinate synthase family protein, partial [Hungatella sp.]